VDNGGVALQPEKRLGGAIEAVLQVSFPAAAIQPRSTESPCCAPKIQVERSTLAALKRSDLRSGFHLKERWFLQPQRHGSLSSADQRRAAAANRASSPAGFWPASTCQPQVRGATLTNSLRRRFEIGVMPRSRPSGLGRPRWRPWGPCCADRTWGKERAQHRRQRGQARQAASRSSAAKTPGLAGLARAAGWSSGSPFVDPGTVKRAALA